MFNLCPRNKLKFNKILQQHPSNKERGVRYVCLCPAFTNTAAFDQKWTDDSLDRPASIGEVEKQAAVDLISKTGVNA